MPSCAGFLEPRKSRLRPSKSTFNAKNFISGLSWSICSKFGAISSWNVSRSPKSPKIYKKNLFWRLRSFKLIEFSGNGEPVYNFLLVINSNLCPISHRYWDTATYWLKIANSFYPCHPRLEISFLFNVYKRFSIGSKRVFYSFLKNIFLTLVTHLCLQVRCSCDLQLSGISAACRVWRHRYDVIYAISRSRWKWHPKKVIGLSCATGRNLVKK